VYQRCVLRKFNFNTVGLNFQTYKNMKVYFQQYSSQFDWWRKPEDPEKTTDLSQVTDKPYYIMLYTSPSSRFELTISGRTETNCPERREARTSLGYFVWKIFFHNLRGQPPGASPPHWSSPCILNIIYILQLSMQSVPITTDIVSSNLDEGEVYNIM
jgi:hypothetical protein